jgi:3-phosphoshikimate 1-carboxyvinyltransferase
MNLIVHQTNLLTGHIVSPSSKSHSIRGMLLAILANGQSILRHCLHSDDTESALQVCRSLSANCSQSDNEFTITSNGIPFNTNAPQLQTGNSGITTHFILPMLGLRENTRQPIVVDCADQMRDRPIGSLVKALRQLGLAIDYVNQEDKLPVTITGELIGGKTEVNGFTSQYLSALLLSLPCAKQDSEIRVRDLSERPYVEMTLDWLREQSIIFDHQRERNVDIFRIRGNQRYLPFDKLIPGDFSSASYLIAAGALIPGEIKIGGLNMQDSQGDKELIMLLKKMGADIQISDNSICISGGSELHGIAIDAGDIPDLLPTLAVLGTYAVGKTEIRHVSHARIKETDRIQSMMHGLRLLGANVEEYADGLTVYQSNLQGAEVCGYDDHRTVMALSLAGMLADGKTTISDAEAINKTYPTYVKSMQSLGANMQVVDTHVR